LLPIVSGVTIVSISFLQRIAVPPYPLGIRNPQPIATEIHKQSDVLKRIQSNTCKYVLKISDFNCKNILIFGPCVQELNNSRDM
jgi:hypothetical protein